MIVSACESLPLVMHGCRSESSVQIFFRHRKEFFQIEIPITITATVMLIMTCTIDSMIASSCTAIVNITLIITLR